MKLGKPLPLKEKYFKQIEKEINRIFYEVIYRKIIRALEQKDEITNSPNIIKSRWRQRIREVMNSESALEAAIRKGKIYYEDGRFFGDFNASTSKALRDIGANFNPKSKTWSYAGRIPAPLSIAAADADARYSAAKSRLIAALDDIDVNQINELSKIPDMYDRTIDEMEADFQKAMKAISVPAKLTEAQKGILTAEYSEQLDRYIKEWAEENILELRQMVERNAFAGRRSSSMIKALQQNYGVSKSKAKFLARQETSLMMSKFREIRYKDAGSYRYKWSGSMDEREREDHKLLEGNIYSWDSPPVTDRRTGARNHPGEDFNCFLGDTRIVSPIGIEKLYRRSFSGKASSFITEAGKSFTCTPNHPMLTKRGWVAANSVNVGDYIANIGDAGFFAIPDNPKNKEISFDELFSFFEVLPFAKRVEGTRSKDFHGDISVDNKVDIIDVKRILPRYIKPSIDKGFINSILTKPDVMLNSSFASSDSNLFSLFPWLSLAPSGLVCCFSEAYSLLFAGGRHSRIHGLASVSWLETIADKMIIDGFTLNSVFNSNGFHALPRDEFFYRLLFWEVASIVSAAMMPDDLVTASASSLGKIIGINGNGPGDLTEVLSGNVSFDKVVNHGVGNLSAHVYNLQNSLSWYSANGYIAHNCRCVAIPVID